MRGIALEGFDVPPAFREDLPARSPAASEVLVRVHASSVNPVDAAIAGGMLRGMAEYDFPVVLGRDFSGVVEQVGSQVTLYSVGDEVFGFLLHANPTVRDGSWTELVVVPEDNFVGRAPAGVELATAGAAPLAGITAMLAIDALTVSAGDAVLIVGATGGVGSFAAQLAARAGATVIAPALPEDEDYVRGLGVEEIVDRNGDVAAAARELHSDGVDALLDLVSYTPDGLDVYAAALNPAGRPPRRSVQQATRRDARMSWVRRAPTICGGSPICSRAATSACRCSAATRSKKPPTRSRRSERRTRKASSASASRSRRSKRRSRP